MTKNKKTTELTIHKIASGTAVVMLVFSMRLGFQAALSGNWFQTIEFCLSIILSTFLFLIAAQSIKNAKMSWQNLETTGYTMIWRIAVNPSGPSEFNQ